MPDAERAVEINCRTCKHMHAPGPYGRRPICIECGYKHIVALFANWEIGTHEVERMKRLHPDFDPQKFMDNYRKDNPNASLPQAPLPQ